MVSTEDELGRCTKVIHIKSGEIRPLSTSNGKLLEKGRNGETGGGRRWWHIAKEALYFIQAGKGEER